MALWCSRLARQPVTLEVDGSSPFGVAIKSQICAVRKKFFLICLCSSVGRAADWKSACLWFDSDRRHHGSDSSEPRCGCSSSGRAPPCQGGGSEFEPRHPLQNEERESVPHCIWYRGQAVRQESAKLSFPSSNLGGTSKNPECECVRDFTFSLLTFHYSLNKNLQRDFW